MASALSWTLVALASLLAASLAAPTDTPDLVITNGLPSAPTVSPVTSAHNDIAVDTTEGPMPPLKVSSMNVTSVINLRYAHTTVLTKMKNPAKKSQEATFSIILPETAFITGFVMTLDGTPYTAYVKGKEEAKSIFTQAVSRGLGAAHIAAKARDSNHFTVSVNIEPTTEALFNLTYEELLTRRLEVYNHVVNLNPGRLVPELTVNIYIKEGKKITTLRVPELRTGNEIDAQESDTANEFATIERNSDNTEAYIKFAPNLEQQHALMQVYAENSKKSAASQSGRRNWWNSPTQEPSMEGVLGQFVVQYDVERDPNNGEVMVNDGYFVHFFSPSGLRPLNKHVIFVLDTSSSMMGTKIKQLKIAMKSILSELKPGDYFNIIEFNTNAQVYDLENLTKHRWNTQVTLPSPARATPKNIRKAKEVIDNLEAVALTNIYAALDLAGKLANKGVSKSNVTSTDLLEISHTNHSPEDDVAPRVSADMENQKPDPIIIFLTDGDPTVGETNVENIQRRVSELNSGPNQTPIYSLAFGEDADRDFLRKLSLRNSGFLRHIYEGADAAQQLQHFYSQVADPLLSHVRFTYPTDQIDEASITKHTFRTLFSGAELVVAGKLLHKDVERVAPTVTAISERGPIDFVPKPPTTAEANTVLRPLERLWVYLHIKQLLDQKDADKSKTANKKEPEQEALELALKYSFVTPLTSLVVVKPNATAAVNAESVDRTTPYGGFVPSVPSSPFVSYGQPGPPATRFSAVQYAPRARISSSAGSQLYNGGYRSNTHSQPSPYHLSGGGHYQQRADFQSQDSDEEELELRIVGGPGISSNNYAPDGYQQRSSSYGSHRISGLAGHRLFGGSYGSNRISGSAGHQLPGGRYGTRIASGLHDAFGSFDPSYDYSTTTNGPQTTVVQLVTPTTPKPQSKLQEYNLLEFQWLEQYLDVASDSVKLPVNGTTLNLKLFKSTLPSFNSDETACTESLTAGSAGTCRYLTDCTAAKNILNLDVFLQHRCEREGYAAVCCPVQS